MEWRSFFLLFIVLVSYLLAGGLMYHLLEINSENTCNLGDRFDAILSDYKDVIEDVNATTNASLRESLLAELRLASYCQVHNTTVTQMSFSDGVYLSLTVMSAIGYGYFVPKTFGGRLASIFYCFTSVPLFILATAAIGEKMQLVSTKLLSERFFVRCRIMNHKLRLAMKMVILFAISQVVFLLLPAFGVMELEGWSYFDSYYFLVVTFLTVGFGDYNVALVANKPYIQAYRVVYYLWTLLGISFIALIIQTAVETLKTKTSKLEEKMAHLSELVQEAAAPPAISGHYRVRRLESVVDANEPAQQFKKKGSNAYFYGSTSAFGMNSNIRHGSAAKLPRSLPSSDPPSGGIPMEDALPALIEEDDEDDESQRDAPTVDFASSEECIEIRM